MNFARHRPWTGSVSTEALCARILARHREAVRVRNANLAVANLARIIDATLKLSNRNGFHATSLRDLAKASGLSMGGLYSYFDNKTMLLSMILGEVAATATEVLGNPPDDVAHDARAHLEWVVDTHVRLSEAIIFDEPTRSVDVGAIVEIHELINRLADEGKAVVVISSYLPEIMALSDRILVSRQGKVVEEFSALEATEEKIMYAAIH